MDDVLSNRLEVIFVRHGDHKDDVLTHRGAQEATLFMKTLNGKEIQAVYHSSTSRALGTAGVITGLPVVSVLITGLFPSADNPNMVPILTAVGNSPKGWDTPLGEIMSRDPKAWDALGSFAYTAWEQILRLAIPADQKTILVVGHRLFLEALGYVASNGDEEFTQMVLGNCEGFRITIDNLGNVIGEVALITLPIAV